MQTNHFHNHQRILLFFVFFRKPKDDHLFFQPRYRPSILTTITCLRNIRMILCFSYCSVPGFSNTDWFVTFLPNLHIVIETFNVQRSQGKDPQRLEKNRTRCKWIQRKRNLAVHTLFSTIMIRQEVITWSPPLTAGCHTSQLRGLMNPSHGDPRHLLCLNSPHISSFHFATSSVEIHVAPSGPDDGQKKSARRWTCVCQTQHCSK